MTFLSFYNEKRHYISYIFIPLSEIFSCLYYIICNVLTLRPVIMLIVHKIKLHANGLFQFSRNGYTSGELVQLADFGKLYLDGNVPRPLNIHSHHTKEVIEISCIMFCYYWTLERSYEKPTMLPDLSFQSAILNARDMKQY